MSEPFDEFDWIASLRPLTRGDPRALDLADDAAVIPSRPGHDLVISQDAMVAGIHFLADERPDIVARRLLRTSLSDLAAKAAEPFGYFLTIAWPAGCDRRWREAFRSGLQEDGERFGLALLGGDTVSTTGPLVANATVLGWAETGRAVRRSGAKAGDLLMVCGTIGDGWLGLLAARGELPDPDGALAGRYRLPTPRLELRPALRAFAHAAADVSDGLIADAGLIASASGLGLGLEITAIPLSTEARAWRALQPDDAGALLALAAGGDDYAIVCAIDPADEASFSQAVSAAGVAVAAVGSFGAAPGSVIQFLGKAVAPARTGWRHA